MIKVYKKVKDKEVFIGDISLGTKKVKVKKYLDLATLDWQLLKTIFTK